MDAAKQLKVLRDEWVGCKRCGLSKLRRGPHILFGGGSAKSEFLVVIEAPTATDVEEGALLSGTEGEMMRSVVEAAKIDPKNIFVVSLVACRPYVVLPATEDTEEQIQDRKPDKEEIDACLTRLHEIIYLVDPRIIVTLGDGPWKTLVKPKDRGPDNTLQSAAGKLFHTWVPGRISPIRYPVMAALSPGHLIANPSSAEHGPIATTIGAFSRSAAYIRELKKDENR